MTLAGADGEMFVSRDYNFHHSVMPNGVVVPRLIDLHVEAISPCCFVFLRKRYQPATATGTQVRQSRSWNAKGSIAFLNSRGQPGELAIVRSPRS